MVEAKGWWSSSLDALGRRRRITGFSDALMRRSHNGLVCHDEADVEHRGIAGAGCVFSVHQDEVEVVLTFKNGKLVAAASFGDFEVEASLEEVGEARDV